VTRPLAALLPLLAAALPASAVPAGDPTRVSFTVPSADVVAGDDMAAAKWPTRLAVPSAQGQFEVLIRKTAAPVLAPHCHGQFLVVRMPASIAIGGSAATTQAVVRKRAAYDDLIATREAGRPIRFDVFAGPYGHKHGNRLELAGCNLFFVEPSDTLR
jgi:hypothetical protein